MDKLLLKENIKNKAVKIFSEKGFYGTSIREIAKESGCSLPMLYYYFNNKEELFYEVAYSEFIALIERMNSTVKRGKTLKETYFEAIKQRKELSPYDKAVYKLSLKVWLGFEGESKVRKDLIAWDEGRLERTKKIFELNCEDKELLPVFSSVMVRVMENMIEKIILLDEDIPDDVIKNEIDFIMRTLVR